MHANRPNLLENGVLILHDSARPHIGKVVRGLLDRYSWEVLPHQPYSPDMSPPDFDLFPKLNINMRGVLFSTLEDLFASDTRRVTQRNSSTDLTGIMDLPKRWDAVIRQKGDYTERLEHFPAHLLFYSVGIAFCAFLLKSPSYMSLIEHLTGNIPPHPTRLPFLWLSSAAHEMFTNISISKCNLQKVPRAPSVIPYSILFNKILI